MSDADRDDAAERVEVTLARLVPDILHLPFHHHERLFVVEKNAGVEELLARREHFLGRRSAVASRLVIERRQSGDIHFKESSAEGARLHRLKPI